MIFISLCCYAGTFVDGDDVISIVLDSSPETNVAADPRAGWSPQISREMKKAGRPFRAKLTSSEKPRHGCQCFGARHDVRLWVAQPSPSCHPSPDEKKQFLQIR
jgi:hypothetical protein